MTRPSPITPRRYRSNPRAEDPDFKLADAYDYRGNAYQHKGLYRPGHRRFHHGDFAQSQPGKCLCKIAATIICARHSTTWPSRTSARSFRSNPRNVTSYYNRALAYEHKGLHDDAIADLTKDISLAPTDAGAYDMRGLAYAHKGLYDQAIADFTQEIALNAKDIPLHPAFASQYASAYSHRADAYAHKGVTDAAIADYRAALKLDPDMQSAKDALTRLGAAP